MFILRCRDRTSNMVIQGIVILSLLITQTLCAPTGCIESCSSYTNQFHTQLSGISNHGDVQQGAAQLQGYDYSRPGTWTEHNDYNINNGKVHEERGQIVDGQKTVKYFKKNYSSSYDTRYPSGSGISEVEQLNNNYRQLQSAYVPSSENVLNFHNQRTYNQVGSLESIGQQQDYNRIQSQKRTQSAIRRTNTQSERLEDFGEHNGNSEVIQQSASGLNTQVSQQPSYTNTQSGNWSKVDSYKTDGGHGRVFEEEGQYTSGPKKVRYYKRNYTSSYSSSNGLPVPNIANIGLDNIHRDIENIHREIGVDHIHKDIDNIHREIGVDRTHKDIENIHRDIHNTVQGVTSSNTAQTNINSYGALSTDSLHSINSDAYRRRPDYRNNLSSVHRNEQQHTSIASEYAPHQQSSQSAYGVSSYRTYGRREGHVNTLPTSQYINPTSGYTNVLSTGNNGYNRNMYNEENLQQTDSLHQAEHLGEHQSTITQNHMDIDNLRQTTYNQHNVLKPVAPGSVFHNEQWSSSHKQETSLPVYSSDISQISGQNAQYNSQYRENSFNSAHHTKSGKLMIGAMDLSSLGNSDDCAQGTVEHGHVHSQYRRIYKRSTKDDALSNQQHKEESDDPTQQTEDLNQQTDTFDDIVQQTSGKLQSGHQSQQTYQPWKPGSDSHESEVLPQQTDDFDDLTQQTSGKIDFGTQSQHSHQSWGPGGANQHFQDITQQTAKLEDFNQQTSGTDDFEQTSQQSHQPWSQHSGLLTQQTDDFDDQTQQTGKLQLGQQSYEPWGPERASQHSGHLTQQTDGFDDQMHQTGKLQLGQQSYQPWSADSASQQTEDLTQQTGTFDDIVQQTSGKLQSGHQSQQTYQPTKPGSDSHESEVLPQQTDDFDDLTQQTSGNIDFGTQSQHSHQSWGPGGANQHFQDITQQTAKLEDFNQQTSGTDDFEQTSQQSHQPWSQHSELLTQQTDDFDDQTQQTGKLQLGQQSYEPWGPERASQHSGHLTQQTDGFDDQMHQTGKLQLGQQSYQPWAADSASQHSGGWTQQTDTYDDQTQQAGKLQLGQQSYQPWGLESASQQSQDMTQQNEHVLPVSDINDNIPVDQAAHTLSPTPVGKPRPRPRYSRVGSLVGLSPGSHSVQGSNNIQPSRPANEDKLLIEVLNHSSDKSVDRASELPPVAVPGTEADGTRSQDLRGDQGVGSSTNNDKPSTQKTEGNVFSIDGSVDQGNWLHKSNDATVGLQWHYTYHPSDQRPLVQQADKKDKGGIQQQSTIPDFSDPQDNLDQQQAQNKHIFEDLNQQSSSPGKIKSGMHQQSQNGQEKDQLEVGQQTLGKTEDNPQHRLEPRILQAYGGGPYDDLYHENIYAGVTVNPSATLAPINTADSWDIREKPAETNVPVYETTLRPLPVEPLSPDTNEPTPAPSFWSRLGNKFTNTFDKAKEKARNIFG